MLQRLPPPRFWQPRPNTRPAPAEGPYILRCPDTPTPFRVTSRSGKQNADKREMIRAREMDRDVRRQIKQVF